MINAAGRAGLERLPCACHILHHSVKSALEKQERLNNVMIKLHQLASFFHRSPKMAQALELEQVRLNRTPQLKAIMDVETRWNSSLAMLRRMVELKVPMAAVRTALRPMPDEQENLATMNNIYPGNNEWRVVDLIIDALSFFEDATLLSSSSDYGLAASMCPWMTMLLFVMEENLFQIEEVGTLRSNL